MYSQLQPHFHEQEHAHYVCRLPGAQHDYEGSFANSDAVEALYAGRWVRAPPHLDLHTAQTAVVVSEEAPVVRYYDFLNLHGGGPD